MSKPASSSGSEGLKPTPSWPVLASLPGFLAADMIVHGFFSSLHLKQPGLVDTSSGVVASRLNLLHVYLQIHYARDSMSQRHCVHENSK